MTAVGATSPDVSPFTGVCVRAWRPEDVDAMREIWNEVVRAGVAFPQEEELDATGALAFFSEQTHCGVAVVGEGDDCASLERIAGLYILHPNNVGRCGHVANASFAVDATVRGRGVGRALVSDAIAQLAPCGFRGLQFNAVVDSNASARHLYESLGFEHIGTIPGGFRMPDGAYEDTHVYYHAAE